MTSRRFATDAVSLAIGAAVNGLAVYVLVALGTRAYGAEDFAPVSVLWTFWALSAALLTFPIQHWIIRVVRVDGSDARVRTTVPRLAVATLLVCLGLFLVAFALRERFFASESLLWPVLVPVVALGSSLLGFVRGILASRGSFAATAVALAGENVIRLALGLVVVAAGASIEWFGSVLASGVLVAALWPSAFRLSPMGGEPHRVAEFLAGLGGGVLLAQVALNAPPAVIAGLGGAGIAVTGAFTALAIVRVPYLIALGFATRLTAPLTGMVLEGNEGQLARIRRGLVFATMVLTPIAAFAGWLIGPWLIDLIFGEGVSPARNVVAAVAAGGALALGSLGFILVLLARAATTHIVAAWAVALLVGIGVLLAWDGAPIDRVIAGFVATEIVAFAGLLWSELRLSEAAGSRS